MHRQGSGNVRTVVVCSCCLLLSIKVDTITQWRGDWSSASVVNHTIVTDPTIQQPGFDLRQKNNNEIYNNYYSVS